MSRHFVLLYLLTCRLKGLDIVALQQEIKDATGIAMARKTLAEILDATVGLRRGVVHMTATFMSHLEERCV